MRTVTEREALGAFVKAGWTAAEFAEHARLWFTLPGKTRATAASYRFALYGGPQSDMAKSSLHKLRGPHGS
jgi:hypothetical protein